MGIIEVTNGNITRIVSDSPGSLTKYAAAGFVPVKAAPKNKKSDKDDDTPAEEN